MASRTFKDDSSQLAASIFVAKMDDYQRMTTEAIALDLGLSCSKVSRLLSAAHANGHVEIRINDPSDRPKTVDHRSRRRLRFPRNADKEW